MLWNQAIIQLKVQWKHSIPEDATWEMEDKMQEAYPSMFLNEQESTEDRVKNKGENMKYPQDIIILYL